MLALMSNVDHPNVRLNFDTGNIAYYNKGRIRSMSWAKSPISSETCT